MPAKIFVALALLESERPDCLDIDRVLGLDLGADDYVFKPFSPRELVARGQPDGDPVRHPQLP